MHFYNCYFNAEFKGGIITRTKKYKQTEKGKRKKGKPILSRERKYIRAS